MMWKFRTLHTLGLMGRTVDYWADSKLKSQLLTPLDFWGDCDLKSEVFKACLGRQGQDKLVSKKPKKP